MGLDAPDRNTVAPVDTGDKLLPLDGTWNKPASDTAVTPPADTKPTSTTADAQLPVSSNSDKLSPTISFEQSAPVITDGDGKPLSDDQVSGLKYSGFSDKPVIELAAMTLPKFPVFENNDVTQVSDKSAANRRPTVTALSRAAHNAVGSGAYGNRVPKTASEFRNEEIPPNLKCASTSSQWLVEAGVITNRDFKIRVDDMIKLLPEKGFTKVALKGPLDLSKFPDGPIGFITGRGNYEDDSNHIGFIEKRDGQLRVIHNNYRTGRVVDQDIKEKFYTSSGRPAYRDMSMFIFPKR